MEVGTIKLAFLLLIVANASVLVPLIAEARCKDHKRPHPPTPHPKPPLASLSPAPTPTPSGIPPYQIHGCGYNCTDSNGCDAPCTICCADGTCCYDEPSSLPPWAPSLPPSLADVQAPVPVPDAAEGSGDYPPEFPPYQVRGCGNKCNDSNECDWPCTECCYHSYQNQTCC